MNFKADELVDVVNAILKDPVKNFMCHDMSPVMSYDGMTQWIIECSRRKLMAERTVHYNALHLLNRTERTAYKVSRQFEPKAAPERLAKELTSLVEKERRESQAIIKDLDRQIDRLNAAYTVVTSSMLLYNNVIQLSSDSTAIVPILKNAKGRWHATEAMRSAYLAMLETTFRHSDPSPLGKTLGERIYTMSAELYGNNIKMFSTEVEYYSYMVTGKAIVYAGNTAGNLPVLLSLNCAFDLDGKIDGLPDSFRVLMFKPKTTTVVAPWQQHPEQPVPVQEPPASK